MTGRRVIQIVGSIVVIIATVLYFRWPRLQPDEVLVSQSQVLPNGLEMEYRMDQPFSLVLVHKIKERFDPPDEPGVHVGQVSVIRKEQIGVFSARYDLLRGEYYVRLQISKGTGLIANGNGTNVPIPIWSGQPIGEVQWTPQGKGTCLGEWCGFEVVVIDLEGKKVESIETYAGKDLSRMPQ
jgi:hypothetical protein